MMKLIFRKIFWCNYDHLMRLILVSLVWTGLNLPLYALLYLFFGSHMFSPWPYVVVWNILWLSPLTAGLFSATLPMVNSVRTEPVLRLFFAGIRRHGLKALLLMAVSTLFLSALVRVFLFYVRDAHGLTGVVRFALSGLVSWVIVYFMMMQANFFAVLAKQDETVPKILYKSFLLVLDSPGRQVVFFGFTAAVFVISVFSVLGLILFFPGFFALSMNILVLVQLSRHNKSIVVEEETRTFRNLLRPWE